MTCMKGTMKQVCLYGSKASFLRLISAFCLTCGIEELRFGGGISNHLKETVRCEATSDCFCKVKEMVFDMRAPASDRLKFRRSLLKKKRLARRRWRKSAQNRMLGEETSESEGDSEGVGR